MTYYSFENKKGISVKKLLALCEIGEDYIEFRDELKRLVNNDNNKFRDFEIMEAIRGKKLLNSIKYSRFIKKYRRVIDIMVKYNCVPDFIIREYDMVWGKPEDSVTDYFFQYLQNHKDSITSIYSLIQNLFLQGINIIFFDEMEDFTDYEFSVEESVLKNFGENKSNFDKKFDVAFLENIEIIPKYSKDLIFYRTKGSCYYVNFDGGYNSNIIVLNSLLINPQKIQNLTLENALNSIGELVLDKQSEYDAIRNSVDLSVFIENMVNQYNALLNAPVNATGDKNLRIMLNQMRELLVRLLEYQKDYEQKTIDSGAITRELLNGEKLKRFLYKDN